MATVSKAVVPAAGRGTRLLPLTGSVPKEMLPVGAHPMVRYVVEDLAASGIEEIFFIVSPVKRSLRRYLQLLREEGAPFSRCRFRFGAQPEPTGIPFALSAARDFVGGERFIAAMPDTLLLGPSPTRQLLEVAGDSPEEREHLGVCARVPRRRLSSFGYGRGTVWVRTAPRRHEIRRFEGTGNSGLRGAGRILLSPGIFPFIEGLPRPAREMTDVFLYERMRASGHRFTAIEVPGALYDLGTLRGYVEANAALGRTYFREASPEARAVS